MAVACCKHPGWVNLHSQAVGAAINRQAAGKPLCFFSARHHNLNQSPAAKLSAHSSDFSRGAGLFRVDASVISSDKSSRKQRGHKGSINAALPVVSGIPVLGPLANFVLNPVLLVGLYAIGATRFWRGYTRTTYADSRATKTTLTAMWPVLFVVSKAYRDNFKKALG